MHDGAPHARVVDVLAGGDVTQESARERVASSGWVAMVNGHIFHTTEPTCGANHFDFFVVSDNLRTAVHGVQRITDAGTHPHKAVRLLLKAAAPTPVPTVWKK